MILSDSDKQYLEAIKHSLDHYTQVHAARHHVQVKDLCSISLKDLADVARQFSMQEDHLHVELSSELYQMISAIVELYEEKIDNRPVLQDWVMKLPRMQQSVLLSAIRNMDGITKAHPMKRLVRFLRRCVLVTAFEGHAHNEPFSPGGGNFTGPSISEPKGGKWYVGNDPLGQPASVGTWQQAMDVAVVDPFIREHDSANMHYFFHLVHAIQILGYQHPDAAAQDWWHSVYIRITQVFHMYPEPFEDMNARLNDNKLDWLERTDSATL